MATYVVPMGNCDWVMANIWWYNYKCMSIQEFNEYHANWVNELMIGCFILIIIVIMLASATAKALSYDD